MDYCDIDEISHLYELRHSCNIYGVSSVSKLLNKPIHWVSVLINSGVHGSLDISDFLSCDDNKKYKNIVDLYIKESSEKSAEIFRRRSLKQELLFLLESKRKNFAGIGLNKAKRRLNKIKDTNSIALALRLSLEIEDYNIRAKFSGYYADRLYNMKSELLKKLAHCCVENNFIHGIQDSDTPPTKYVFYVEIPGCEQISWHCDNIGVSRKYSKEWDGKENSTLLKLESLFLKLCSEGVLSCKH